METGLDDEQRKVMDTRRRAYQEFLKSPHGQIIMDDLAYFCCADRPTFEPEDPHGRISAYREGRREVYLRFLRFSRLEHDNTPNA